MKRKFVFAYALFFLLVLSCRTSSFVPVAQDEEIAQKKWAGTDLSQLNQGYKIYNEKCQDCHKLHKPTELDEAGWAKIVPKMGAKAKISEADQQLILHYILTRREALLTAKK